MRKRAWTTRLGVSDKAALKGPCQNPNDTDRSFSISPGVHAWVTRADLAGAARAFDRSRQFVLAALARYHMAYLEFLRGHYNAGLKGYYETRDRLARLGSLHPVAWCDLEIAEILLALNAFDDALQSASSAHARFKELEARGRTNNRGTEVSD
ncbi:MAG: hypothetical protein AABN33_14235 [Acidobacteriota bacterium]